MSMHNADILSRLKRFLGRKQTPRRLEGSATAATDEIAALVRAIERLAPRSPDALAQWWPGFEAALGEACGGMWPTEKEVADVARRRRAENPQLMATPDDVDMTSSGINARRLARGEPVGEDVLWGETIAIALDRGLVSLDVVEARRSAAIAARAEFYGTAEGERYAADMARRYSYALESRAARRKQWQRQAAE